MIEHCSKRDVYQDIALDQMHKTLKSLLILRCNVIAEASSALTSNEIETSW
jgi:hypothetical protein